MSLPDALIAECIRVRDEIMPAYLEIGQGGKLALAMMRAELNAAYRALAYQDATAQLRLLESLRGYTG